MRDILVVIESEALRFSLRDALVKEYRVTLCGDGDTALSLLRSLRPQLLLLDLSLPGKDGLTLLEEAGEFRPPVILCLTDYVPPYIAQVAKDLGVGYITRKPCPVNNVAARIADMLRKQELPAPEDPQEMIGKQLLRIGFSKTQKEYQMLRVGIPLFAQAPDQQLKTEFYPAVAELCVVNSGDAVEYALRTALKEIWKTGNQEVWQEFFPGYTRYPTTHKFLKRMAKYLLET